MIQGSGPKHARERGLPGQCGRRGLDPAGMGGLTVTKERDALRQWLYVVRSASQSGEGN